VSLGKAAKLARLPVEDFIAWLGVASVPAVDYPAEDVDEELAAIGAAS
jgi:predicted HTH domain antitoxin